MCPALKKEWSSSLATSLASNGLGKYATIYAPPLISAYQHARSPRFTSLPMHLAKVHGQPWDRFTFVSQHYDPVFEQQHIYILEGSVPGTTTFRVDHY